MVRKRRRPRIPQKPAVLILCEDTSGVYNYLSHLLKSTREDKITVVLKPIGEGPKGLIREGKKGLISNGKYGSNEFVVLVFDFDERAHFDDCVMEIHDKDRMVPIVSFPCVEYFLLLHFVLEAPELNSKQMMEKLKSVPEMQAYSKNNIPILALSDAFEKALKNCQIRRENCKSASAPGPRSDIDILVEYIECAKNEGIKVIEKLKEDSRLYRPL